MAGGLINTQLPAICFFITVENGSIMHFILISRTKASPSPGKGKTFTGDVSRLRSAIEQI